MSADQQQAIAQQERERAEKLAARLKALGIDPDEGDKERDLPHYRHNWGVRVS
jgi:heme oxygenase